MSSKSTRQREDELRLAERAAEWVIVLPQASAPEREEFVRWIQESPVHLQEFLAASAVARGLAHADLGVGPPESHADEPRIVHLTTPRTGGTGASRTRRSRAWTIAAGVAAAAVALTFAGLHWFDGATYRTGIGEQRTLQLGDGSLIQMNVGSRVNVSITESERRIQLLEGEALFTVTRDPKRPFRVHAGGPVIEALGTRFNVRRRDQETRVSVVEGLVQVSNETGQAPALKLAAGETTRIDMQGRIAPPAKVDPETVAAWHQRRLDFRAEPLAAIAAEFNRYNEQPRVEVVGEAVGARRYSGVFDANDPRALVDFLREDAGLSATEEDGVITIRARQRDVSL